MQLYEICDTTIKVKESSSLDFVSNKLIGVDKIKYTGSLQKLYEDDFETFMYYNAVDSVLVQKIHQAKDYISIIYAISSLSKIKVVDVVSQGNNALASLAITEGVLRERFRKEDIVLFRGERSNAENEGIAGGWVKDPVPGLNQWVVVYDFSSLYPHVQMQWFIAPENFVGVQDPQNKDYCLNGNKIDLNEHVVCVNGVVFRKLISPTISMLQDVFMDRKKTKKSMMVKMGELENVLKEIKQLEMEL
jgi:DNA polymerase elongation subunit (family B)